MAFCFEKKRANFKMKKSLAKFLYSNSILQSWNVQVIMVLHCLKVVKKKQILLEKKYKG